MDRAVRHAGPGPGDGRTRGAGERMGRLPDGRRVRRRVQLPRCDDGILPARRLVRRRRRGPLATAATGHLLRYSAPGGSCTFFDCEYVVLNCDGLPLKSMLPRTIKES